MGHMKSGPSLEDRFQGCLLGLAIGDALGYPTEFLTLSQIQERYGPSGIQDLPGNPALHSDDTQMSISVSLALIKAGHASVHKLMEALSKEFLNWLRSPENDRSPGNTCIEGCQRLEAGVLWNEAGIVESKGCGANMRVAPIGLYYWNSPEKLRLVARCSALITHAHPAALIAAEVTAFCVAWAVQGMPPADYLDRIRSLRNSSVEAWDEPLGGSWKRGQFASPQHYLNAGWNQVAGELDKIPSALSTNAPDVCETLGGGWVAEQALACALACVLITPNDYRAIVQRGANSSGDSDSIASIAGAISGAYLGVNAIPRDWRKKIENRQTLIDLSKQLYVEYQKEPLLTGM